MIITIKLNIYKKFVWNVISNKIVNIYKGKLIQTKCTKINNCLKIWKNIVIKSTFYFPSEHNKLSIFEKIQNKQSCFVTIS